MTVCLQGLSVASEHNWKVALVKDLDAEDLPQVQQLVKDESSPEH
jgi:hypothetical protein